MAEVYRNNFGRNHYNHGDSADSPADDTIILADTIVGLELQFEGDYEERVKALEERVKELEERKSQLIREVQDLQSSNDQLTQATIQNQEHIDKLSKQNEQLCDAEREKDGVIASLQAKMSELQAKVSELQAQVNELKIYKCGKDKLYLCQVAVEFEGAICSHVLPEVFSISDNAKINDLLNIINSGDEASVPLDPKNCDIKTILSGAQERWRNVCGVLKLPPEWETRTGETKVKFYRRSDPDIFRAIAILKHARNFVAHPSSVTVQIAEETIKTDSIKSDFKEWEYKLVQDFILSLRANIEKIGINQDRLKIE